MSSKKIRKGETQEDDRISSLPDDVLCRILSLLPTKYAVSTTVLSSRWKILFAYIPDLDLDDSLTGAETTDSAIFTSFVSNVLCTVLKKLSHVRKFRLKCAKGQYCAPVVSLWISAAAGCNSLQELLVYIKELNNFVIIPPEIFACRTLTTLKLQGTFFLCVPSPVLFPSLKSIELSNVILGSDDSVRRFFHGCIVLEDLCLSCCVMNLVDVLEVSVSSLKKLYLNDINGEYEFVLDAPSLEYFNCNSYASKGYYGNNLNSLVRAVVNINFEDEYLLEEEKVSQLINMVSTARSLALSGDEMEVLTNPQHTLATFHNLTELKVYATSAIGWELLPTLLDNAPRLEVLSFGQGFIDDNGSFMEINSYLSEWVPTCVSSHLKEVRLGLFDGDEDEYKTVEYFLKNAKVLEKVIISPSPSWGLDLKDCPYLSMKKQFPMTKRLLTLPRCSRACRIVFTDGYEFGL